MCGIVGYVGDEEAAPILLHGLAKLEYRGYDSAGIAVRKRNLEPQIMKAEGKLINLINLTDNGKKLVGNAGIGHTRWATHGAVSIGLSETQNHINSPLFKVRYIEESSSQLILKNGGNIKCVE